ncbi:aminopeptidase-like protein 6 [Dinothrombium tinctorium]|uniref:Aminopeptidase-like protein 6 n=1 Tax=Dinothrombium tinctorium TaxID=1965070 RepID=A0A443QYA0_9ACAR|nr:aminopeptidase-like protein 6 [Dinothrombium tinctorium]
MERYTIPLKAFAKGSYSEYDCLLLITIAANDSFKTGCCSHFLKYVEEHIEFDKRAESEECLIVLPENGNQIRRLVHSPGGRIDRDFDDVRRFRDAAYRGVKRALAAGAVNILVAIPCLDKQFDTADYSLANLVTVLASFEAIYVPLEIREAFVEKAAKVNSISFCNYGKSEESSAAIMQNLALAIEAGRAVARDIGGSDPERMSPPKVAEYVRSIFSDSSVKVQVFDDASFIKQEFPCLAAVNRGSSQQHKARVILLTYEPSDGPIEKTLCLVGKGVCYDTGGHDIKAGGIMAGMHRDKCGAAAVAGFLQTVNLLKPKGIRVVGAMAMVRNSIGPDAYVADELITARSGVRLRIGNTDAEGRMAMVDVLCFLKEEAIKKKYENPHFFTIATLTGHACIAVGDNYSIIMDNGPARKKNISQLIQQAGDRVADPFEISSIKREDFEFNKGKSEYEDILQSNNLPSSRTPRGHQIPAAFLITVSGLDKYGLDSSNPLPYSHIDIAGSSGPFPGIPSGAPIPALTVSFLNIE